MRNLRTVALSIVGSHWIVAMWHLFVAARVLPAPNDHVSSLAVSLITLGHLIVCAVVWKLSERVAGVILLIFFLAALGADAYEHFLHASLNNIFTVASGPTGWFDVSVFLLLALEIIGCSAGIQLGRLWPHRAAI